MTATIILFNPTVAPAKSATSGTVAQGLTTLAGKVVGFIDNSKPNFKFLVDEFEKLLLARYGVARVERHRKPNPAIPAGPNVIQTFAARCDLVIAGSGD